MTIKDVARLSGCGVGTVSRVLNHQSGVSEETRRKVLEVVETHHFRPNGNAKHLKQQISTNVAIVVKGTHNMLFAAIVEQAQAIIQDSGREAAVYYLDEDANEVIYAAQLCRERKPQGILFLGGDLEFFQESFSSIHIPCVLLTNTAAELDFENLSSLTTDDRAASAEAVDYLISLGHTQIGILGGNWSQSRSQISYRRLLGCQDSFQRHGLHQLDCHADLNRLCEPARYSMTDAYQATGRLMDRNPDLTAIFVLSDVMAIGAIRALKDRGLRVPEDISVIGYDGLAVGDYSIPRLATIQQDASKLAQRGVELLLNSIEETPQAVHELVPFRLIPQESAARPNH